MSVVARRKMIKRFPQRKHYDIEIDGYTAYRYIVDFDQNVTIIYNKNVYSAYPDTLPVAIDIDEDNPLEAIEKFKRLMVLK